MLRQAKALAARIGAAITIGVIRALFGFLRLLGPDRSSDLGGWLLRTASPLIPVNRVALANIRATFPGMPDREVKRIARAAWENLGRVAAEYAHLKDIFDYDYHNPDRPSRVEVTGIEHFIALKDDAKPGLIFSAHLANWELPAICAATYDLETTAVFRAPNDPAIAAIVHEIRSGAMGGLAAARQGAAFAMQGVLENGGHLGMLIDQHFTRGVVVPFLGRPALTNPILGKFARRFECPVHGVRVIRLPNRRFRIELTPPLDLPRDAAGEIDVRGAMAMMTAVVDGWVREYPEQWLWMHRRWRPNMIPADALAAFDHSPATVPVFKAT
ncbi:lipid A biosynthesis lauroyl acyltransferase [Bosea sp. (in: a-proteobacteria)]|uniref:lipid A biosynthesis lauroyl acyltransferase n=1 Tax=Bosea sp. (in: a-proteobacteria) TaxID=1871050 RepID=UPI00121B2A6C|nr:lipid A biosynthesis lauroyl acyltransferase [Bosea sp. (in: a-proteobacteria)]TAJ28191.1 MAG: lipid A biosynthesis lauroyl acyltransferase [Bosea sp. (in: a-proteobacteria)]